MKQGLVSLTLAALFLATVTPSASAQNSAAIQTALDRPVKLSIPEAPIGEVFKQLSAASGVRFVVTDDTIDCLPHGSQMRMTVKITGLTLREALTPMLLPEALTWNIQDNAIVIVPTEGLYRMGRRATLEELKTLGKIYSSEMAPLPSVPDLAAEATAALRKATGNAKLRIVFYLQTDESAAFARGQRVLPGSAAKWLDMVCRGQGWTWVVTDDKVIILPQERQVQRQLMKTVTLQYQGEDLTTVLLDLARMARVKLTMDPGVLGLVPAEKRKINLSMTDAAISQALEVISGATGLKFVSGAEGVTVEASDALKNLQAPAQPKRPPFFLKMVVPLPNGETAEAYMSADELPPDVVEAIQAQKARMIEKLRAQYNLKPPTTVPAETKKP